MNKDSNSSPPNILVAPLAFVSLALLAGQVGYLLPEVSRVFGAVLWLAAVFLAAGERRWLWLGLSALLLFNPFGPVHRPEGLILLPLLPWAGGPWARRWMGAAFLAAVASWIWIHQPALWVPLDEGTAAFSNWLTGLDLSSAAAGFPLLAVAACFPLAALLTERRPLPPLLTLVALIVAAITYIWVQKPLTAYLHHFGYLAYYDAFNLQWVLLAGFATILLIWCLIDRPKPVISSGSGALLIPLFALAGSLLAGWPVQVQIPRMDRTIILYDKGYLNWNLPRYGFYGRSSGGMFGLLPDYLAYRGFKVDKTDSLTTWSLETAGAVVIVNLTEALPEPEEAALRQFVEQGGSLLLLGDHTGMAQIRDPSNRLLKPYGIALNFDSAKPRRTGWVGSLVTPAHPLTAGVGLVRDGGRNPGVTQIWVGASLQIETPARPVIIGRAGFSDSGDPDNEKDGYLGDFRYRWDEHLGNQVLLAEARRGQGKVLVFGDTSTLQNGALARSGPWTERIFKYLLSPTGRPPATQRVAGILLLLTAVILWSISAGSRLGLALAALLFFAGATYTGHRTARQIDAFNPAAWTAGTPPRAIVDYSHAPRIPLNQTGNDGTWGLKNTLLRSRLLPVTLERWDKHALLDAHALIEIAPARGFSRADRVVLDDFMRGGGEVILCCGTEEFDGSRSLLDHFGLQPVYVPLGPADVPTTVTLPLEGDTTGALAEKALTVRFHEAWEIRLDNPAAQVLLAYEDRPVIVRVAVGDGGLTFIADSWFLTNRNLESPAGEYVEENILYLRYLLREYAGGE